MTKRYRLLSFAALVLAAVMLCGCFAGADEEKGLLRTAINYDITTMDVAKTTDDYMIPMNVFDRLFETRVQDGNAVVVPSLCTEYKVSEDGLTYEFTLMDGVVFSNGNALTASDVQYSFARLLILANQNTDIPLEVVGGQDVMDKKTETLEGFKVADDTHFTITLSAPNAGFLAELSSPVMSIVDKESMTDGFGTDPAAMIGTGPYIVTEWVANDHYTMVYNEKYRGPEPTVKKIIVKVIADANTQNLMFQNGELDLIDLKNQDSAIIQSVYKTQYADRMVSAPNVGMIFIALNENNEFLKDVNVRKAIGAAIDVDTIITALYNGDAIRENGIIPTGVWGHNDNLQGFTYDPETAKKLLADAGYTDGQISFEIAVDNALSSTVKTAAEYISQSLNKVGFNTTVKNYDHAAYLDVRRSGTMDSFVASWGMDYNDPANIMVTFFGSEANVKARSLNYPDTAIIARVASAPAIVDDEARKAEYQALEQKIISEDAAWIPLYASMHLWCRGPRVASFTPQWAGFTDFYVTDVVLND
jgi:peptide/nickel transport system substrate-binding protein